MCKPKYALDKNLNEIDLKNSLYGEEYTCPNCKQKIKARKAKSGKKHFYHIPTNKTNESQLHLNAKKELLSWLKKENSSGNWGEERYIKKIKARPDISGRINGIPVVFEIQHSPLTAEELNRRTLKYSKLGIYTIWVIPEEVFKRNPKAYEKYLHMLYKGNLFLWAKEEGLKVAHFFYKTKTKREVVYKQVKLNELHFTTSSAKFKYKGISLPEVKIMTIYKWWTKPVKNEESFNWILVLFILFFLIGVIVS